MAKLDRLLNLTAALLETTVPLSAEEIRAKVPGYGDAAPESFRRTFERDKDDLRELGVPIETVTVEHHEQPHAAYTIERDRYELPDPGLDPDELAALHLAATAVQLEGLDPDDAEEALRKLGGVGSPRAGDGPALGALPTPDWLLELFVAVLERRVVRFTYGSDTRTVEPARLQFERGRWYLTGHDRDRDDRRTFRLDRVVGPVSSGHAGDFERPEQTPAVRLRPWELGSGDAVVATVLLDPAIARSALAEDPALAVAERRADGSVVVALEVRNRDALVNFVLSLLDRAELLGPPELRDELVQRLEAFEPGGST